MNYLQILCSVLVVLMTAEALAVGRFQTTYSKIRKEQLGALPNKVKFQYQYQQPLPVVLWHGMGDTANNKDSMGKIKDYITGSLETQVFSIQIGDSESADQYAGYFGKVMDQIADTCKWLKSVPELQGGFNGVGFSQGSQFLRGLIQTCEGAPQVKHLITLGGQHQGIMGAPNCQASPQSNNQYWCSVADRFIETGAYWPWVRTNIVQAQYYKNPDEIDQYLKYNTFLAHINNEVDDKILKYKDNFQRINKLVLVKFENDTLVYPKETSWFGYYNGSAIQKMEETELYQNDYIGLKYLNENKKVDTITCPGGHMQFTLDWFNDNIIKTYLQ